MRKGVSRLLGESAAIEGLERMVQAVRTSKRPEAMSVLATFALLRSLQGDTMGNTLLAQATEQRRVVSLVPVAQPSRSGNSVDDCWAEYERTLDRNYDRYSRCLRDYWWNQPVQYACGLEFAMVAELALFHVIACSGGFPVECARYCFSNTIVTSSSPCGEPMCTLLVSVLPSADKLMVSTKLSPMSSTFDVTTRVLSAHLALPATVTP
jgi:hypothetical protein